MGSVAFMIVCSIYVFYLIKIITVEQLSARSCTFLQTTNMLKVYIPLSQIFKSML